MVVLIQYCLSGYYFDLATMGLALKTIETLTVNSVIDLLLSECRARIIMKIQGLLKSFKGDN